MQPSTQVFPFALASGSLAILSALLTIEFKTYEKIEGFAARFHARGYVANKLENSKLGGLRYKTPVPYKKKSLIQM